MRISIAFMLVLCCLGAAAQSTDSTRIKKIVDEVMSRSRAYENLRYLCKKVGPRLSGSPQAEQAVQATAKMLKEAGADTVYLQPCMVPHWVRGAKEQGKVFLDKNQSFDLHLAALGNSVGTGAKGVTAEVVEVTSFAELNELGEAGVKGKIVFFNFAMNPTYINTFRAYGESGAARRRGASQAAKFGAVGVMVRSLASNPDDYPHTGGMQYNDSFPKIPAVAISTNDADRLSIELTTHESVKAFFKTNCATLPDVPSFNVVGEIRGTELPNEIITVGGHLDSWDLGEGANDDGSGCVQSIEVLRALKATGLLPKRTVRAVMFMDEENRGSGGDKYFDLAKAGQERHIFALESDAGGFSPRGFGFTANDAVMDKLMAWKPLFYPYGVYEFRRGGGGSDIDALKELGTVLAGLSPDGQRYFDIHHAASDVFENVSRRELHLGAANMAALVWLVSEYGL